MVHRTHPRLFALLCALVAALITLPYLYAWRAAGETHVFTGFLLNPLDGASYLAKMQQGWQGAWRYRLAFTAGPGRGAYLFLYYLFLGHLARWTGLSLLLVYHLARLAGALALLYALDAFYAACLPVGARPAALMLAALGSGMGWLAVPLGGFTADFWVVEAYPFLSMYAAPHFPLSLALMALLLRPEKAGDAPLRVGLALILALLSPFGMALVLLARGALAGWDVFARRERAALRSAGAALGPLALGGLPYLLYTQWAVRADPALAAWNAQNLTPAPPWWDTLLAFSPLLPLAVWAAWRRWRRARLLVLWSALALLLLYAPLALQRRFLVGLYIPLAGLAAWGLSAGNGRARWGLLAALTAPTNLFVLLAAFATAGAHPPELYLTRPEADALAWLAASTPRDAVVLAAPETGAFIPAFSGRRVLYGHPFETVDAARMEAIVLRYFSGLSAPADAAALQAAQYLFYGPRERALGGAPPAGEPLYANAEVAVYPYPP